MEPAKLHVGASRLAEIRGLLFFANFGDFALLKIQEKVPV